MAYYDYTTFGYVMSDIFHSSSFNPFGVIFVVVVVIIVILVCWCCSCPVGWCRCRCFIFFFCVCVASSVSDALDPALAP